MSGKFTCPVCDWPELEEDPETPSYEICPQCGVEFGYEPREAYPEIRRRWEEAGRPFWNDTHIQRDMWYRIHACF